MVKDFEARFAELDKRITSSIENSAPERMKSAQRVLDAAKIVLGETSEREQQVLDAYSYIKGLPVNGGGAGIKGRQLLQDVIASERTIAPQTAINLVNKVDAAIEATLGRGA